MERMVNQSEVTEVLTASAVALFVQSSSISDTPFSTLNTTRVFWCGDLRIVDHSNGREYRNHEVRSRASELGVSLAHLCEHLDDVDHPSLSHWEFAELPFFMIECDQGYVSATRLNNQLLDINEDWFLADERDRVGGSFATPVLSHHRAYGSVPRRFLSVLTIANT